MILLLCDLLLLLHSVHHASTASLQRWTREAEEECIYSERTLVCNDTKPCTNLAISPFNEDYLITPPSNHQLELLKPYDVYAFRLCGANLGSEITLQEADKCSPPNSPSIASIKFQDCDKYFKPLTGDLLDLEIYAFINDSCSLQTKFLIINTTRVDPCTDGPSCHANSHCKVDQYTCDPHCVCDHGFYMSSEDGTSLCVDIDECSLRLDNCGPNSDCINTDGSFICNCKAGYTGDSIDCTDINECEEMSHNCANQSTCINQPGSFSCTCKDGYTGNGTYCSDIDECSLDAKICGKNSNCYNTDGSFKCSCEPGYTSNSSSCIDINECAANPCPLNQGCENTAGGYECKCLPGYEQLSNGSCTDVNECDENICPDKSFCMNMPGSYLCTCMPGYTGSPSSQTPCTDVNECMDGSQICNSSNSVCVNTLGSYLCECEKGYRMEDEECKDIDECLKEAPLFKDACPLPNEECVNKPGHFSCECIDKYTRSDPHKECESLAFIAIRENAAQLFDKKPSFETVTEALEFVSSIVPITMSGVSDEDLSVATQLLVNVTGLLTDFQEVSGNNITINESLVIIEVLDNVLVPPEMEVSSEEVGMGIVKSSETYGEFLLTSLTNQDDIQNISVPKDNIFVAGVRFDDTVELENFTFPASPDQQVSDQPASITLPGQLLQSGAEGVGVSVANLLVTNVDRFFPTANATTIPVAAVLSSQTSNSDSAAILAADPAILEFDININMEEIEMNDSNLELRCVFFQFSESGESSWSSDGVSTEVLENGRVRCVAKHLTSFTVLLSPTAAEADNLLLQIFTKIALSFSLVCLFLTIIFFITYGRALFVQVHYFVHLNLSISLFMAYGIFIFADLAIGKRIPCIVVAALLNYFFLAVFCWMLCEAVMLYLMLVVVFSKLSKRWWFFLLLGWGPPFIFFAVTYGVFRNDYVVADYRTCWLAAGSGYHTIYMFIGPAALIVLLNILFIILVFRSLCKNLSRKKRSKKKQFDVVSSQIKALLILLPLVGLTWVFGFLVFNEATAYSFGILAIIFNGLQGIFIFFFHVFRSDRIWGRLKRKYGLFSSHTTSSAAPSSVHYVSPRNRFGATSTIRKALPKEPQPEPDLESGIDMEHETATPPPPTPTPPPPPPQEPTLPPSPEPTPPPPPEPTPPPPPEPTPPPPPEPTPPPPPEPTPPPPPEPTPSPPPEPTPLPPPEPTPPPPPEPTPPPPPKPSPRAPPPPREPTPPPPKQFKWDVPNPVYYRNWSLRK